MPRVGFEPTIPALERAKTFHAVDRAATVIGHVSPSKALIKHMTCGLFHDTVHTASKGNVIAEIWIGNYLEMVVD
jgi:hypothetical protein